MSTTYPGSKQTFTNPAGTQTLDSPDHAAQHANANDTIEAIQDTVGTTAGTNVLKDFSAGEFPARVNAGGTIVQTLIGGTINASVFGTPDVTGGTLDSTTINSATVGTPDVTGGTASSITLGTPIMDAFTTSGTTVSSTAQRALAPTVGTLTDSAGGTITTNAPSAQLFELNLGTTAGNRTLAAPTNPTDGQLLTYRIKQNTGNTGTIVWDSVFRESSDISTPELGTESTFNYYGWRYNNTDTKWDFQGQSKNLI